MPGKIRRFFAGGNTGYGFYSFYDQIVERGATAYFILKGGPGVGKSSFMRAISQQLRERGYAVEEFYCSSDETSLDAVRFPALGVALVDGTSPHIVDPRYPGVVDTIVHLGDFWREDELRQQKAQVMQLIDRNSLFFRRAYGYLDVARRYNNEQEAYLRELQALDIPGLNRLARELIDELLPAEHTPQDRAAAQRHLFASAITPGGLVNHLSNIFAGVGVRIVLQGPPGSGRTTLVQKLLKAALERGLDIEAFHCALDPQRIEHLLIPELSLGVITSCQAHTYDALPDDRVIETGQFVDQSRLAGFEADIEHVGQLREAALLRAVDMIQRARQNHDRIEACYVPHMDFGAVARRRRQVLERILELQGVN
ncbi:MAG: PRK06851 family protein [Bacillota bacterium]|jgi:GTPase SAR1 family protein